MDEYINVYNESGYKCDAKLLNTVFCVLVWLWFIKMFIQSTVYCLYLGDGRKNWFT